MYLQFSSVGRTHTHTHRDDDQSARTDPGFKCSHAADRLWKQEALLPFFFFFFCRPLLGSFPTFCPQSNQVTTTSSCLLCGEKKKKDDFSRNMNPQQETITAMFVFF